LSVLRPMRMRTTTWIYLIVLQLVLGYTYWYWTNGYEGLVVWWHELNPDFFGADWWTDKLFTQETYAQGRWWCIAALACIAIALGLQIGFSKIPTEPLPRLHFSFFRALKFPNLALPLLIASLAIGLWWIGTQRCPYATDEVFSWLYFGRVHTWQTLAHYPLPNNHLLFNALNGVSRFFVEDGVATGRIVSGIAYVLTLLLVWFWTIRSFGHLLPRWFCLVVVVLLAVQFPAWGFATQARGYSLQLLCSWASLICCYMYFVENQRLVLRWFIVTSVIGFLLIPTFLYWWVGLLAASAVWLVARRKWDFEWFRAQWLIVTGALLGYLPLLTFSGLKALTDNKYVRPLTEGWSAFVLEHDHYNYWRGLLAEWFALTGDTIGFGFVLMLLPLFSWFFVRRVPELRPVLVLYACILVGLVVVVVYQRRWPFYRNLVAQAHVSLYVICISSGLVLRYLAQSSAPWLRSRWLMWLGCAGLLVLAGLAFQRNKKCLPNQLYYYDVAPQYDAYNNAAPRWPKGSVIHLHDQSYYWWAVLHNAPLEMQTGPLDSLQVPDYQIVPRGVAVDSTRWDRVGEAMEDVWWRGSHRR
jgi:hypothetical protein